MKLKDVYVTWEEVSGIKVVPRPEDEPQDFYAHDPQAIKAVFVEACEYSDGGQAAFDELMKVQEFRELRDARGAHDLIELYRHLSSELTESQKHIKRSQRKRKAAA
jgi:hypothetical protein